MQETTSRGERRILALDAARGFAAFGILMVNVQTFGGPWPLYEDEPFRDAPSQIAYGVLDALFVSKFFPLFSLLFGIGLALQMDAAKAGERVGRFVARRMAGLFAIGLVHVALFSTIDILVQYAALGFVVYALRDVRPSRLIAIAAGLLAVPPTFHALATAFGWYRAIYAGGPDSAAMIAAYAEGDLRSFFAMRLVEIEGYYAWVAVYAGWTMLAMMLVGLAATRAGLVRALESRRTEVARLARVAFAVGLPAAITHAVLWSTGRRVADRPLALAIAQGMAAAIGEPAMAVAYATGLALLATSASPPRWLALLANVGKLALSSYVLQSIVLGAVAFSWGLGRYGEDGPIAWIGFVLVTYACELAIARVVVERFGAGPLERLWRWMTYGERARAR